MRVLIACEFSATVREAFTKAGHDATSCDLLPTDIPGKHYQGSVEDILYENWDLMIGHPPCTYLTVTANKWMKPEYAHRFPDRPKQREEAIKFFMLLANAPIKKIALENPVGVMSTRYRKPDQIIQPYHFGHPETKKTCLWLKGLPPLEFTNIVEPEFYYAAGKKYSPLAYNSTASIRSRNKLDFLPPQVDRWKLRSKTYLGIASAMATQWGNG